MTGWTLWHLVLYYTVVVGGFVGDILIAVAKAILFPGAGQSVDGAQPMLEWEWPLRIGFILAGAAGISGGMALMRPRFRRRLWRGFWIMLSAGWILGLFAFGCLIQAALQVPA